MLASGSKKKRLACTQAIELLVLPAGIELATY
jgi:hypothetical protein